jgi:hypothetical protein
VVLNEFHLLEINRVDAVAKMRVIIKGPVIGAIIEGIAAKEVMIAEGDHKEKQSEYDECNTKFQVPTALIDITEFKHPSILY